MKTYKQFLDEQKLSKMIGGWLKSAVVGFMNRRASNKKEAAKVEVKKAKIATKLSQDANDKNLAAHTAAYGEHKWRTNNNYDKDPVGYASQPAKVKTKGEKAEPRKIRDHGKPYSDLPPHKVAAYKRMNDVQGVKLPPGKKVFSFDN